ncbi:MAG: Y-family DNA polymerase [Cellvibrionaceae bacterium]
MFALVDCNSCYASCEQIFRPDLRGKPVVVLSNNDGCIIARSKEAKQLGIPDLQPYFKIKHLLREKNVTVFSANFTLYGDISYRFVETVKRFSPNVEQYSIDEVFVSLSGVNWNLKNYGQIIKRTIWKEIRMPVGIGIGPTKTLAKLASHAAKKIPATEGVCVLDTPEKWQWVQKRVPVIKIWGVGHRLAKRFELMDINTAWDLANASPSQLRRLMNVNIDKTVRELNGVSCIGLEEIPPLKKEIFVTRSFGEKATEEEVLLNHISRYASAAAEKLRKQKSVTSNVHVFVQTSAHAMPYYANQAVIKLPYPTNDSRVIIRSARRIMSELHRDGFRYAKCGVGLLDVSNRRTEQFDMFIPRQTKKSLVLMKVVDRINEQYGSDTAVFAAEGFKGKWSMRQDHLSPAYTTRWKDLPVIKMA